VNETLPSGYRILANGTPNVPLSAQPIPHDTLQPIPHDTLQLSPDDSADLVQRFLRPQLVVVLSRDVTSDMTPGAITLAIGGGCLALEVLNEQNTIIAALIGERLLPPEADGPVSLYSGSLPAFSTTIPSTPTDRVEQLSWLASTKPLSAGQLVFPVPQEYGDPIPVVQATWEIRGPCSATLIARTTP